MGMIQLRYRLPLVAPQPENHARIRKALEELQLLPVKETEHENRFCGSRRARRVQ